MIDGNIFYFVYADSRKIYEHIYGRNITPETDTVSR